MLSYLHGYHAGNHADLIKHITWLAVLDKLHQKTKPFSLIDTHAGAGCYPLDGAQALKTQEFKRGVALLQNWKPEHPVLRRYQQVIGDFVARQQYPGSPLISVSQLRDNDQLHLMELHPGEFERLRGAIKQYRGNGHSHVHHRDGLEGTIAMCPPKPNRGAILIDPPYEQRKEYNAVIAAVEQILKRWPQAQIVLWYPLLSERAGDKTGQSEAMCESLASLPHNVLKAELCVDDASSDTGMYGSGVCLINPAWQIDAVLTDILNELTPQMGVTATSTVRWLHQIDA
ncbi:23S rRNA (adenine(2030)-N(6))-methyltransferase RlmJ [Aestuariibacter sp. GS-14]|uniref:23S rRNA (adenine(2030)-N(6))-methyltransferase RlmJ n=1 Tax=Aestuariibacter sp. GS-14 TaxID=2590670 RepID=UPI00112D971B|nr:23S rRNA (adenine(2030)-N(6))-methyltransferase RlmJ [Aestuariibacter sp. GS-14]TPV60022.1 23S rRNA (adenine(2030)-N(6))-methyltransferase RlmJ [Aestuariibacter sp. GS-14]